MNPKSNYKISLSELFQFNLKSRLKILRSKGVLLLERIISKNLKVKVYSFYGAMVQVFESITHPKEYQIQPIYNVEWLDTYLRDIDLKKLGL